MGKNTELAKINTMPSTTTEGTDLPSRPHFSPHVATTHSIKNKAIAQTSSPLSIVSTTIENDLLDVDKDKVRC